MCILLVIVFSTCPATCVVAAIINRSYIASYLPRSLQTITLTSHMTDSTDLVIDPVWKYPPTGQELQDFFLARRNILIIPFSYQALAPFFSQTVRQLLPSTSRDLIFSIGLHT